jgi:hypothetical protein
VIQKDSAGEIEDSAIAEKNQQRTETFSTKFRHSEQKIQHSAVVPCWHAVCITSFDAKEAIGLGQGFAKNTTISTC